jgi:hypothetical protein
MSGYGIYVLVCAYFPRIVDSLCPPRPGSEAADSGGLEEKLVQQGEKAADRGAAAAAAAAAVTPLRPTVSGDMYGFEYGECLIHGFLFKSSRFYTKTRMAGSKWQRRWFMLSNDELRYCKNPLYSARASRSINMFEATGVRRTTPTEFELQTESETYCFKAQKPDLAANWVAQLQQRITVRGSRDQPILSSLAFLPPSPTPRPPRSPRLLTSMRDAWAGVGRSVAPPWTRRAILAGDHGAEEADEQQHARQEAQRLGGWRARGGAPVRVGDA